MEICFAAAFAGAEPALVPAVGAPGVLANVPRRSLVRPASSTGAGETSSSVSTELTSIAMSSPAGASATAPRSAGSMAGTSSATASDSVAAPTTSSSAETGGMTTGAGGRIGA